MIMQNSELVYLAAGQLVYPGEANAEILGSLSFISALNTSKITISRRINKPYNSDFA